MISLGSIRGTTLEIDFTFFILVGVFAYLNYNRNTGIEYALLWVLIIFISVLFHELAHAATIGLFGYGSSRVILGGMGGVTINARVAEPWHDMLISVIGPVSSFALAYAMKIFLMTGIPQRDPMLYPLVYFLALMNTWLGWFNLVPVPPLDGGHFVRHLLRTFQDEQNALNTSMWIAIIGGGAAAVYFAANGFTFAAVFVGWCLFMSIQQWRTGN
ncbi:MAG TPA: site-2 protease family protein [Thermoanaerobaculia bacterium]|nr:site-2 protease family protein [Thermoanaerobaculia bacterium]